MQILQPSYLFLLGGLLLPLAIHLWNRKQGKVVAMGTLRFLRELPKEQINSVQLTQKRLLLLRWLILILPILFLLGLVMQSQKQTKFETWVLLSPEMAKDIRINKQLAVYDQDAFKIFLSDKTLTSYLLEENKQIINTEQTDYASLISRINNMANKPDSLVVYTTSKISHFSKVPEYNIPLEWVQVPDDGNSSQQITAALLVKNDSLKIQYTSSNSTFVENNWSSLPLNQSGTTAGIEWQIQGDSLMQGSGKTLPLQQTALSVLLAAKDTSANEVAILKAAFRTLNTYLGIDIKVRCISYLVANQFEQSLSSTDYVFLIDSESIPENYPYGRTCLINTGNLAIQQGFYFKEKAVLPQIYLDTESDRQDANLVAYLANCLFPQINKATTFDNRRLTDSQLQQFTANQNSTTTQQVKRENNIQTSGFSNYYLLAFCVVLIGIERWLSMNKNNG